MPSSVINVKISMLTDVMTDFTYCKSNPDKINFPLKVYEKEKKKTYRDLTNRTDTIGLLSPPLRVDHVSAG